MGAISSNCVGRNNQLWRKETDKRETEKEKKGRTQNRVEKKRKIKVNNIGLASSLTAYQLS